MAKAPTADAFYNSFGSKPEIIRGEPTYKKLVELRDCIYANASQIKTQLGGGKYGYLGALIPDADYIALPNTVAFVVPANPGNFQAVGIAGTANEIANRLRAHLERQRQNVEHDALMQALRNMIIDSVEEQFIQTLRNRVPIRAPYKGRQKGAKGVRCVTLTSCSTLICIVHPVSI
jgi:hypothetical protein